MTTPKIKLMPSSTVAHRAKGYTSKLVFIGFSKDAVNISHDSTYLQYCVFIDTYDHQLYGLPHRDAVQLIALGLAEDPNKWLARYSYALLDKATITDCSIMSDNKCQGIFCSDGLYGLVVLADNKIRGCDNHAVTLSGVLSGVVSGNKIMPEDEDSNSYLWYKPYRIGGGGSEEWDIIQVINFSKESKAEGIYYKPLMFGSQHDINQVIDDRWVPHEDYMNLVEFNYPVYKAACTGLPSMSERAYLNKIREYALDNGTVA